MFNIRISTHSEFFVFLFSFSEYILCYERSHQHDEFVTWSYSNSVGPKAGGYCKLVKLEAWVLGFFGCLDAWMLGCCWML